MNTKRRCSTFTYAACTIGLALGLISLDPQRGGAKTPKQSSPPADQSSKIASACEKLTSLTLSHASITQAQVSALKPAQGEPAPGLAKTFCRVTLVLAPSNDSNIQVELWMPASWNGKFQGVGNGAFNGSINVGAMAPAVTRGYATASTDTGHTGNTASWAPGHPEKVIDFGWRAIHEMAEASKKIMAAYYGAGPRFSYFNGCSAGGRQAMKEAQRFPNDFDGIVAGSPGLDWTGRAAGALRAAKPLEKSEAARLGPAQRELLHKAAVESCDAVDGLKDGLIGDPRRCKFDPGTLLCRGSDRTGCLSPAQLETARLLYSEAMNPKTRRWITGLEPGSELGWTDLGWTDSAQATALEQFRFLVYNDPKWTIQKFNFDSDIVRAEDTDHDTINALDPNLAPFFDRGGKLIQYHGWADPQISPESSTQYYSRVVETVGAEKVERAYRLFMAPGMAHCGGGEGPNLFDAISALEQWVEQGKAPDQLVASHMARGAVDRTRPLCPYPQVAKYKGAGSIDDAANFTCRVE